MPAKSGGSSIEQIENGEIVPMEENIVKVKHTAHDADEAMKAIAEHGGEPLVIDAATNKRLLRTIDWHMMPILCLLWGLYYLDKTTLSYASIMGIQKDLHLVGSDYQWLGSLFYIGYLAWEYPTSVLLQRLPLAKYSAFCIVVWGVVLALFAVVSNYAGAVAIRFVMGMFEAAVTPSFALFVSQWYVKSEHGYRMGLLFSFNGWGQILGGSLAYGIARGVDAHGSALAGWKVIFVITGCMTVALGIWFFLVIPDNQLNCRWLSKRDRVLAVERVRVNDQGIGNKHFKFYQLKEALLDPLTWTYVLYAILHDIPNGGLTNFFSELIISFGYTSEQSLLYGTPGGAFVITACMLNGWAGDRFGNRALFACLVISVALLGVILIVALPLKGYNTGRLIGYYMTQVNPAAFASVLSLIASNVAGYTKKTTVGALYLIGFCVGNIIGPQTFRPQDAPRYVPAEITMLVCYALAICDLAFIWWWSRRQNRKNAVARSQPGYTRLENQAFLDLTDKENMEFVYTL